MRKPPISFPRLIGTVCTLLGVAVAASWLFQWDAVARLIPGAREMGIVNPLLFIAIGICFFFDASGPEPAHRALHGLAAVALVALVILPAAYLFEAATGLSLGIDIAPPGAVATIQNPNPGQLSPNAALAFLCAGLAFWLLRRPFVGRRRAIYLTLTAVLGLISLAGLAGHFLGLEALYQVADANRILPVTAFGLAAVSAGLWALQERLQSFDISQTEKRIRRRSLAVITLVAASCGVAGFAVMRSTFEESVSRDMLLTATTNATSFEHTLDVSLWFPRTVATRPTVAQTLGKLSHQPEDDAAKELLQRIAESFLTTELTSVRYFDVRGTLVASAGTVIGPQVRFLFPLNVAAHDAVLGWNDGHVLLAGRDVFEGGRKVGRALTEQRLLLFDRLLEDVRSAGSVSDAAMCSRANDQLLCAPTRLRPEGIASAMFGKDGKPLLPVAKALLGQRGVESLRDSRGTVVVAAYAPIGDYGLAFAVRTEVLALYGPMRARIPYLLLAVALIVALAVYALSRQVHPVLMRLVESEQTANGILEEQSELISLAKPDGTLMYVNPAYARHFGMQPAQMIGTNLYDHVDPAHREAVRAVVANVLEGGVATTTENRMVSASGAARWVSWTNAIQLDPEDGPLLHSVGRDITDRRQAEERLADSERFVRKVTDSLPVRIAYVDRESRYQFVNTAQCRRFGLPREQILGRKRRELTGGANDTPIEAASAAALQGQEQRFEYEENIDGQLVCIESRLIPDVDESGHVRGFYKTGVDITERSVAERALRDLTTIFDNTTDWVVQTDWRGKVLYMNPAARQSLALGADADIGGFTFSDFNTPETSALYASVIVPATKSKGVWIGESTVRVAGGRVVPINHMVIAHRGVDGRINRYSAIMRDISEEVAIKQNEARQAATLRSVTEAIPAMVAVIDADGRYRFINSSLERWMGAKREAIIGRPLPDVLGRARYERTRPWIERVLAGETANFEESFVTRGAAKHLAISFIPLWLDDGEIDGFVSVTQDVTHHKLEEIRLLRLSQRDPLTGLLNRAGFEQVLQARLDEPNTAALLCLLYIDLDRFKPVNDAHGHLVGDQVLQQFAQRLSSAVRPTDAVARLGGDEFAIALDGIREKTNAQAVAEKIVAIAHEAFEIGGLQIEIGASVGVAFAADGAAGWRDLLAEADAMLYRAKAAGRGQQAGAPGPAPLIRNPV
jgi:diguanylate cyclase (GGDEF)-like protein/PAS domain S-box-containing protein